MIIGTWVTHTELVPEHPLSVGTPDPVDEDYILRVLEDKTRHPPGKQRELEEELQDYFALGEVGDVHKAAWSRLANRDVLPVLILFWILIHLSSPFGRNSCQEIGERAKDIRNPFSDTDHGEKLLV
jgi:hypothetical protein